MRAIVRFLAALCCLVAGAAAVHAEKRVALIVGNASYAHIAGLPNVRNDAAAMLELLRAANFAEIDALYNLNVDQLRRALKAFAAKTADADVAVLYYAGHGIEVGQTNYLIPVDARLATDFDIEDETVPLDRVLQAMEPARRLRLVLLDACRENPFLKSMKRTVATRSVGRGLGRVEPANANTLIAFATKPNAIAEDGKGPNSPFTAALVKHLLTPGLDLRIALGKVRDEVMAVAGGRQEPYVTSSLGGEVVAIVPGAPGAVSLTPPATPKPGSATTATRPPDLDAVGKRFATGSRAGSDVTVEFAHGIDSKLAFAGGKASPTDDEDHCENGRGLDLSSAEWRACLSEMKSRSKQTFTISANCTLGTVRFMDGPWFLLPDRSRTRSADCQAPNFWVPEGQREEVPWQEVVRPNSAFLVLCPASSRAWFLADKRC
jgi:hypothetical protein